MNNCGDNNVSKGRGNGFLVIVILYILLAIILGGSFNNNTF